MNSHSPPFSGLLGSTMRSTVVSPITPIAIPHLVPAAGQRHRGNARASGSAERPLLSQRSAERRAERILIRPNPGFYVMRLTRGAPLVPALIYQLCPMVVPQPGAADGPHPDDWCRPLDRSPHYRARIDGKPVAIDRVWTTRSLRAISPAEYQFRISVLRQWARAHLRMPEARPQLRVNLAVLPPLF